LLNIQKLLNDYSVMTVPEGHKHYREGWVNVICPFCSGDPGYHLGWNLEKSYAFCWRCGFHPTSLTIAALLRIPIREANKIIHKYKNTGKGLKRKNKFINNIKVKRKSFKIPNHESILKSPPALRYMKKRGFNSQNIKDLEKKYHIGYTGYLNKIDTINLSFRILAPIYFEEKAVTWQTRDISGKSPLKYLACPKSRELIHHKHLLYYPPEEDVIYLTEGVFDVWKVWLAGYPVTCGFGVELKSAQILFLQKYKKVILFLDPDKAGINKSMILYNSLLFTGIEVERVNNTTNKDAGDMSAEQIKALLK